jgi:uncharacterized protein
MAASHTEPRSWDRLQTADAEQAATVDLTRDQREQVGAPARGDTDTRQLPVVVTLRPIASGLPFGFFGLVVAATLVGAQIYGFLPASAGLAVGLMLIPTVIVQLVGGIACLVARDVISASLMLVFSGVWLGTALVYIVHPTDGLVALGIWYFALAPVIGALICAATGKLALALVPVTGLPTFLVTAVWLVYGGKTLAQAAGILSFILAFFALYAALALLLEDARRHTVLPTIRRGAMKRAFTGDFDEQLVDLEHEAGVRRYV